MLNSNRSLIENIQVELFDIGKEVESYASLICALGENEITGHQLYGLGQRLSVMAQQIEKITDILNEP